MAGVAHERRKGLGTGLLAVLALLAIVAASAGSYLLGTRSSGETEAPVFTRLTFQRGSIRSARVAPDGQTIVYGAAWDGQPIRIFTTRAGSPESSRLDLPDADILAISSQGEMAISIGRKFLSPYQNLGTLARVALVGGAPRLVLEDVQEADWSPDGNQLAAVREVDGANLLEYPIGSVLYETRGWISAPRVSPDGQRVAFLDHVMRWDNGGRVAVVDLEGNLEHLTPTWGNTDGLAWSAAGDEIWFASSLNEMARGIYAVTLGGEVRKVYQQAADLTLFDLLADGRALVGSSFQRREVRFGSAGEERELPGLDWSLSTFLSRDGSSVLINEQGEGGVLGYSIYLRNTDGSPPVHIGMGIPMGLSPDGQWVLARTLDSKVVLYPTGAGSPREIATGMTGRAWGGWLPDSRRFLFSHEDGGVLNLFVMDLDGSSQRLPIEGLGLEAFSDPVAPDGTRFVARDMSGVVSIVPLDGGKPEIVPGLQPGDSVARWSNDGRHLLFYLRGMPAEHGRYDIATGRRELLGELAPPDRAGAVGIWPIVFSGDGRSYAYSYPRFLTGLYLAEGLR
jgi:Tol biopolymer transport system component